LKAKIQKLSFSGMAMTTNDALLKMVTRIEESSPVPSHYMRDGVNRILNEFDGKKVQSVATMETTQNAIDMTNQHDVDKVEEQAPSNIAVMRMRPRG
jgi:hypothetical protein